MNPRVIKAAEIKTFDQDDWETLERIMIEHPCTEDEHTYIWDKMRH